MNKVVKVCAYCRVSTNNEDQANSYDNQQRFFQRELSKNPKYELTEIYHDRGITGTSLYNRQDFDRMLYEAGLDKVTGITNFDNDRRKNMMKSMFIASTSREPKFKYIFVKSTSRFARNIFAVEILQELRTKGVFVQFLDKELNTEFEKDMDTLIDYFKHDALDSKTKSKSVKWGHEQGALNGVILTNNNIYGYVYIKEGNHLEIVEEEAEVIRKIFQLYSQGYGIRRIINHLNENNKKTRAGKGFAPTTINKLLQNEKYKGFNVRMKYTKGDLFNRHYPKVKPREEWIMEKSDKIPPIVSEELFDKCQELRDGKVSTKTQKGVYKGNSEYSTLIVCGKCGHTYTSNIDRGRKLYNCGTKKTKGTSACDNINISLAELDYILEDYRTNKYKEKVTAMKEGAIQRLMKIKQKIGESFDLNKEQEINELNSKLKDLEDKNSRILDLYIEGQFDKNILDEKGSEIKSEIVEIKEQIKELSKDKIEKMKDIEEIEAGIEHIFNLEVKDEYTKEEIMGVIKFIEIRPYPMNGREYPTELLNQFYHIKRNRKLVALVDVANHFDKTLINILEKYKGFK